MKKRRIIAAVLAAVMSTTVLPEVTQLPSFSVTASAASKLAAPENFAYTATENSITLKWSKVSVADAYRVFMFDSDTDEYEKYKNVTNTSCKISDLSAGKNYKFKVAALVEKKTVNMFFRQNQIKLQQKPKQPKNLPRRRELKRAFLKQKLSLHGTRLTARTVTTSINITARPTNTKSTSVYREQAVM